MIPVLVLYDAQPAPPAAVLLDACTAVVAPERCVEAARGSTPIAIVTFRSPNRVEVHVELAGRPAARVLEFLPEDLPEARDQAVGLVVGALVLELGGGERAVVATTEGVAAGGVAAGGATADEPTPLATVGAVPTAPSPPAPSPPVGPDPPARPVALPFPEGEARVRSPGVRWSSGVGALVGPGLTEGPARLGGFVGVRALVWGRAGLGATLSAARRAAQDGLSCDWLTASLGPRLEPRLAPRWALVVAVEGALERWSGALAASDESPAEDAERAYFGVRMRTALGYRAAPWVRLTLGAELVTSPGQEVRVAGDSVGANPTITGLGLAGVEIGRF